jgi:Fe2+ transport system protein FeoA
MFDHTSRYYSVETATLELRDGRVVSYVRRRFLPAGSDMPLLAEVGVTPGERIDLVSNRTLGDPLAFWRICDANDAMDPREMLNEVADDPNRRLRIPRPQV